MQQQLRTQRSPFTLILVCIVALLCGHHAAAQITEFPYHQDFEGDHNWSLDSLWETQVLGATVEVAEHGRPGLFNAMKGQMSYAYSPVFDCSAMVEGPLVSMYILPDYEEPSGHWVKAEYSVDG